MAAKYEVSAEDEALLEEFSAPKYEVSAEDEALLEEFSEPQEIETPMTVQQKRERLERIRDYLTVLDTEQRVHGKIIIERLPQLNALKGLYEWQIKELLDYFKNYEALLKLTKDISQSKYYEPLMRKINNLIKPITGGTKRIKKTKKKKRKVRKYSRRN